MPAPGHANGRDSHRRARLLVIGYGNPLRRDDGFGPHVAEALLENPTPGVEVIAAHQLTPELAEALSQAGRAVFVDAGVTAPPGEIIITDLHPGPLPRSFTHHVMPEHLLELARQLYGHVPPAQAITAGPVCLDNGEGLSPEVEAQAWKVAEQLRQACSVGR